MSSWSVDPDRVAGVMAGVDDAGVGLIAAVGDIEALAQSGVGALRADGRTVVSQAWERFMDERVRVPGKLVHVISRAATAVTEATVAVVTGDEVMAADGIEAQNHALDEWGIDLPSAYYASGVTP